MFFQPCPEPPAQAIHSMAKAAYGFSIVDLGADLDLAPFERLILNKSRHFNAFCSLEELDAKLFVYFQQLGDNSPDAIGPCVEAIHKIGSQILQASGKQLAWFCLKASLPTEAYDLPRWHMDGYYYRPVSNDSPQYRFAITLLGPSTLFYLLPTDYVNMRRVIWAHMTDRLFTAQLCSGGPSYQSPKGEGVFFIAASAGRAALHTEPPIHEKRLFFSMVPYDPEKLESLTKSVMEHYKSEMP